MIDEELIEHLRTAKKKMDEVDRHRVQRAEDLAFVPYVVRRASPSSLSAEDTLPAAGNDWSNT